jgi:hypothetical protein
MRRAFLPNSVNFDGAVIHVRIVVRSRWKQTALFGLFAIDNSLGVPATNSDSRETTMEVSHSSKTLYQIRSSNERSLDGRSPNLTYGARFARSARFAGRKDLRFSFQPDIQAA